VEHKKENAGTAQIAAPQDDEGDDEDDEDDYGPAKPQGTNTVARLGPTAARYQDLQHRNELNKEDEEARREDLWYARKQDRKIQKEQMEDLVPRAAPGTRERQLEKKKETAAANRSFREAKSPGAEEVPESDLLGDDGIDGLKAKIRDHDRKKNERELRKEEILRARAAEREERLAEYRAKEQKTMESLKAIAKQRFG